MLRVTIRFPLGMYHAQSGASAAEPEWPPSPLRLLGALLAAAHGRHGADPGPDRELLQRVAEAPAPQIAAPDSVEVGAPRLADEAVRLRGATRWAPRNYVGKALSPRNIGRERAEVSKTGVAIGDRPVEMIWPEIELAPDELARLAALASDVTFLGTTRSPAVVEVAADLPQEAARPTWTPISDERIAAAVAVRVPDARAIADFDKREAARRSAKGKVAQAGMVPQIAIGQRVCYARPGASPAVGAFDPRWWGDMIVLVVDRRSELQPKAPAAYLLARAVRLALLGTYGDAGSPDEAPSILTARGGDPHCAIVPLPHVWGSRGDGRLLGVAVLLPHEARVPDLAAQRARVERGLRRLLDDPTRFVQIPGAGRVQLALPDARAAGTTTLRETSYRRPARCWVTVTPVVHARWRKGGTDGLLRQVTADCAHVGLPAPARVEVLRGAGRRGGADRMVPLKRVPEQWRGPLQGPADHLQLTFDEPVHGPVLLGRARHFGVGLCVPGPGEE